MLLNCGSLSARPVRSVVLLLLTNSLQSDVGWVLCSPAPGRLTGLPDLQLGYQLSEKSCFLSMSMDLVESVKSSSQCLGLSDCALSGDPMCIPDHPHQQSDAARWCSIYDQLLPWPVPARIMKPECGDTNPILHAISSRYVTPTFILTVSVLDISLTDS